MGLFDFVADAGEKLTEKVLGSTANEEATRTVEVSPQRVNELRPLRGVAVLQELPRLRGRGQRADHVHIRPPQEDGIRAHRGRLDAQRLQPGKHAGVNRPRRRLEAERAAGY